MKTKKIFLMVFMVAVLVVLSACGGNDEQEAENVTITFYTWWGAAERSMGEALVAEFESRNPGITVEQHYIAFSDYLPIINAQIAANNVPNVFIINEFLVTEWGEAGIGQDIMPHLNQRGINPDEFWVETALYTSGNSIWGINPSVATTVLFYNKSMFEYYGLRAPSEFSAANPISWDEFVSSARVLTRDANGLSPYDDGFDVNNVVQWGTIMPDSWIYVLPLLYAANTSIADDSGHNLLLNSDTAIQALQNMADLSHVHNAAPVLSLTGSSLLGSFPAMLMNEQLGMFVGGTFLNPSFGDENFDVGIAQIPSMSGQGNNMAWGAGFMLGDDAPEEAVDFFLFLSDFNNWVYVSQNTGLTLPGLPQTNSVFTDPELNAAWLEVFDPNLAVVVNDILQNGSRTAENVTLINFSEILDQNLIPLFDRIWLGDVTAAEGVAEIEQTLSNLLEGAWGN